MLDTGKTTFALFFGTRGFFPASLIAQAREDLPRVLRDMGHDVLILDEDATRYGAVESTREHCTLNRVRARVRVVHGHFGEHSRGRFDLGLCNVLGHEFCPIIPDITRVLQGGRLIASGLTEESAADVRRGLESQGWRIRGTRRQGEWVGLYAVDKSAQLVR